ncbi:(2Fe-2S)-binding protein [Cumulibacter soli]|uniref:(2Fe-2S)-binding protein n=1 Tax=Cumulibacter soli TaxID=2546344 RepID=UPI00106725F2|nr:(2Fe-2S)-binding protein [Cumulibacter soli]
MADVTALLRSAGFAGDGVELRTVAGRSALRGTTLAQLVEDPGALASAVDAYADLQQEQFGPTAARHVAALWLLQDVSWIHAVLSVGLISAHGVSLRCSDDGLAMELPRDMFFGVQLAEDAVMTTVATNQAERALAYAEARHHLAALLAPLQEPMHEHLRAGARAFWACVTDMATGAICTGANGDEHRMASTLASFDDADTAASCDDASAQLLSGEQLVSSPAGPIRRRHGCCLLYTIEGMSLCFSCPRIRVAG